MMRCLHAMQATAVCTCCSSEATCFFTAAFKSHQLTHQARNFGKVTAHFSTHSEVLKLPTIGNAFRRWCFHPLFQHLASSTSSVLAAVKHRRIKVLQVDSKCSLYSNIPYQQANAASLLVPPFVSHTVAEYQKYCKQN